MRKFLGFGAILLVVVVVAVALFAYSLWGRSVLTKESGFGKKMSETPNMFSLIDEKGVEKVIIAEDIGQYNRNEYQVTFIPAQSSFDYSVGYFAGWEDVNNSRDKYILLREENNEITRYRIVFEVTPETEVLRWRETVFEVENVGFLRRKDGFELYKKSLSELGFEDLRKVVRQGDVVVIDSMRIESDWDANDESGVYLTDRIIIRRSFGVNELELELLLK